MKLSILAVMALTITLTGCASKKDVGTSPPTLQPPITFHKSYEAPPIGDHIYTGTLGCRSCGSFTLTINFDGDIGSGTFDGKFLEYPRDVVDVTITDMGGYESVQLPGEHKTVSGRFHGPNVDGYYRPSEAPHRSVKVRGSITK